MRNTLRRADEFQKDQEANEAHLGVTWPKRDSHEPLLSFVEYVSFIAETSAFRAPFLESTNSKSKDQGPMLNQGAEGRIAIRT